MSESTVGTGQTPETLMITLSNAYVEQVGDEGVAAYIGVLESGAQAARDGADNPAVEEHLRSAFDAAGIELADPRYPVLADQLVHLAQNGGPLTVATDDGRVLTGPALEVPQEVPSEEGEPDPASPDRPAYS